MFNTSLNNGESEKVGTIKAFGGSVAPFGWLICDGSAISRTLYAALFDVIGENYGAGDGSTTFNIPDASNKFLEGNGAGFVSAGLPNITGHSAWAANGFCDRSWSSQGSAYNNSSGALYATKDGGAYAIIGGNGPDLGSANTRVNIDASRSSSIYGNSSTVQPAACKCYFIIKY